MTVTLVATTLTNCWTSAGGGSLSQGGGLYLSSGNVVLTRGTLFSQSSIYLWTGLVTYVLPAPPGHWIAATECKEYYKACPQEDPLCTREAQGPATIQPCDWANQPQLKGSLIEMVLSEGTSSSWDTYPYACAKGLVGGANISEQRGPLCAGQCPEGQMCPRTATTQPEACPATFYCELGSAEPIRCPAGTWSDRVNLTSAADCTDCARGEYCTEGKRFMCPAQLSSVTRADKCELWLPQDSNASS